MTELILCFLSEGTFLSSVFLLHSESTCALKPMQYLSFYILLLEKLICLRILIFYFISFSVE